MKPYPYYKTVSVPYPSRDEFTNVFVYSKGEVVFQGPYSEFKDRGPDRFKGMLVEKIVNEDGMKEQRRLYGAEASRLEQEFKADLFEEHGVTENPKANQCFAIAYDMGHHNGHECVANYFDTIVDLIK
jgi:hypothetical protein